MTFFNVLFCSICKLIWLIIYLVYWYVWYYFDYHLVLASFISCLFTYFKNWASILNIYVCFSLITDINRFFEIPFTIATFHVFLLFVLVIFFKVNKMASASGSRNTGLWFAFFLVYSEETVSEKLMWWKQAIFLTLHQFLSHCLFLLASLQLVFQLYQIWYTKHWK